MVHLEAHVANGALNHQTVFAVLVGHHEEKVPPLARVLALDVVSLKLQRRLALLTRDSKESILKTSDFVQDPDGWRRGRYLVARWVVVLVWFLYENVLRFFETSFDIDGRHFFFLVGFTRFFFNVNKTFFF